MADALRKVLESDEQVTKTRFCLQSKPCATSPRTSETLTWLQKWLSSHDRPPRVAYSERWAASSALFQSYQPPDVLDIVDIQLDNLPLDADSGYVAAVVRAAIRLDGPSLEHTLLRRLERSMAARQSLETTIEALAKLRRRSKASLQLLLDAAKKSSVSAGDQYTIAWAFARLGDDRAVPVLSNWLRSNDNRLKERSLSALEQLDSPAAAREVRPLLKPEAYLPYKLRMARLLARHHLADGYALATEHLADASQSAEATLVLVCSTTRGRPAKDLSAILAAKPDHRWRAAALTGLAAIGDAGARKQLLEILVDDRNPLAADMADAVGLAGDAALLTPLARLVQIAKQADSPGVASFGGAAGFAAACARHGNVWMPSTRRRLFRKPTTCPLRTRRYLRTLALRSHRRFRH